MMAGTSKQDQEVPSSEATPYEQEFDTEVEKEFECSEALYERIKSHIRVPLGALHWGRVPFNFELERIQVTDEKHKDLILNVFCNSGASDPHWRCSFTVSAVCTIWNHESRKSDEQSMTATRTVNSMVLPILRMPASACADGVNSVTLKIKIKMNSWAGNFASNILSFNTKTNLTDATLIVEGRHIYVSRAILALHSTFFYTLFFDNKFPDAGKEEFHLKDVEYDEMILFLHLVYPNIPNDKQRYINCIDTIELMLSVADRFGCDAVTKLMEKYLMGEMGVDIAGFTLARRLLIADRFRLSAPCSMLMEKLRRDDALQRLGETEEYWELSESLRASILDMRMRRPSQLESPDSPDSMFAAAWTVETDEEEEAAIRGHFRQRARQSIGNFMPHPSNSSVTAATFFGNVDRLAIAMGNFAVTSQLSDRLESAVQYLQNMHRAEFDQIMPIRRHFIHSHILHLLAAPRSSNLRGPISTLLTHVELLRSTSGDPGPSSRKRMRMRDFVLRP